MLSKLVRILCLLCFTALPAFSAPDADATHNELRGLRDEVIKAWNEGNTDAILPHLHPNVVVTWQNGQVSRGRDGVKSFLQKMLVGPEKVVESIKIAPTVAELTILSNNNTVGIAYGTSDDEYKLTTGFSGKMKGHWSVTALKENGRWLISNFHSSINAFENPLVEAAKKALYVVGFGALLAGLLAGYLGFKATSRRSAA